MQTTAIEKLKELEKDKYRIKDETIQNLVEKTKKANWFMDSIIQTNNDLGNYIVHKIEQSLKKEITEDEIQKIKNIIIENNYDKSESMIAVQKYFKVEFHFYNFEGGCK